MTTEPTILLAEDDDTDVFLLKRALKEADVRHRMSVARDGQEAIELLSQQRGADDDRLPVLTVLDLKMPRKTGLDVLHWIRSQPVLRCLPVVIFSSSSRGQDVESAYALGANAFIVKPASTSERRELAQFLGEWLRFTQPPLVSSEGFRVAKAAHGTQSFPPPL